ncbi:MAG: RNA polymerase sigma factor [Oscillospiraceae bacterium]|nr:RNA polymerase sigma factor [Oscillospiraceae bacterium]
MMDNIEKQYDKIYRYCYFKLHNRHTAEDITQETFLKYFDKYNDSEDINMLPMLYTIAGNIIISEYRKKKNECTVREDDAVYNPAEEWAECIDIRTAVSALSEDEQELLLLRYANDVPVADICKIIGISRFALYRRLNNTVKKLRSELMKGGYEI